jgi:hypothetical protein
MFDEISLLSFSIEVPQERKIRGSRSGLHYELILQRKNEVLSVRNNPAFRRNMLNKSSRFKSKLNKN